jgi:hypothetical protein
VIFWYEQFFFVLAAKDNLLIIILLIIFDGVIILENKLMLDVKELSSASSSNEMDDVFPGHPTLSGN